MKATSFTRTLETLLRGAAAGAAGGCALILVLSIRTPAEPPLEELGFIRVVAAAEVLTDHPGWSRTFPDRFDCDLEQTGLPFCMLSHADRYAVVATIEADGDAIRCLLLVFEPDTRTREEMMEEAFCHAVVPERSTEELSAELVFS